MGNDLLSDGPPQSHTMGYRTLRQSIEDLEAKGQVVRIEQPIDPNLEAAEIQRRVFQAGGPVIYFASVKGCRFPMVCNLFGTMERMRYLFRDSLESLRRLVELSADPADAPAPPAALSAGAVVGVERPAQASPQRTGAGEGDHASINSRN